MKKSRTSYSCFMIVCLFSVSLFQANEVCSQNFCPDSNHPHAIDLGLSVRWACCNVGAGSPTSYGGYYAWGEIRIKKEFYITNYAYYNYDYDSYGFLGQNISGSKYDVAHVKWGGSWVMPNNNEWTELRQKCFNELTSINGTKGLIVTGPNGNQIFLPASGDLWHDGKYGIGEDGCYWSSICDSYNEKYANIFWIEDNKISSDRRYYGRSVRPVYK